MPDAAVAKLQALVRIPTVSHRDPALTDTAAFAAFLEELARQFPLVHERLELTRIHTHALLFRWRGRADTRPVVLMAHLDVVPVEEDAPWQRPAFGAEIVDDEIWGRGTLDDKGCLVGICEAVERLLADGFEPAQDVWLSFGCDEEVSGAAAGLAVAELTAARGAALVRPGRGRRGRRRRVPRHRGAGGGHRGHREGRDVARALRRGPRRSRLDAAEAGPDGTDRPGDHPARARAVLTRACRRPPRP